MTNRVDIRDRAHLDHRDVAALNFVRDQGRYVFRRHFRQGLRSHVIEMLCRTDVALERRGGVSGGIRRYPAARPVRMFRIFRSRFSGVDQALEEIRRLRIVEAFLPPDLLARSEEFIVDYRHEGRGHLLLCGLQEAVFGEVLDPWGLPPAGAEPAAEALGGHARRFVAGVKQMAVEAGYIPDIAGVGNLFATAEGRIKLVDINNISRLPEGDRICLDDRGYPACDKSIEALALIERHLCGAGPGIEKTPPYDRFLQPKRMEEVRMWEKKFVDALR
jgi:hypothetical protein